MAATTADVIVDRVRSILASPVFGFTEAVTWSSFDQQPDTNIDRVYRIPPPSSQRSAGGFGFTEDRTDVLQIWVARKHHQDMHVTRSLLLRDVHSLTTAILRDAHEASGDYGIPDEGRGHAIADVPRAAYVTLRLTLPVNYDCQF
jgi:hypothetical protein